MLRFILYARASTKDKQHPDHQLTELRGEAARRGWEVVGEIIELESGRKDDRPLWTDALDRVLRGEADGVAAVELSRFARSTKHLLDVSTALRAAGRHLVTTRQPIDTTGAMGRLLFTILAAVAEFEAELTRERVSAGVRHARAKRGGKWGRGRTELPARVKELIEGYRDTGFSWRHISRSLWAAGFGQPPRFVGGVEVRRARPWPIGTLRDATMRVELPPQK